MSQKIKIAINGFGRIGRNLFRLLINHPSIEVVAINDIADNKTMSHLLKYDSIHGILSNDIQYNDDGILIDGKLVYFFHEKEIKSLFKRLILCITGHSYLAPACIFTDKSFYFAHVFQPLFKISFRRYFFFNQLDKVGFQTFPIR